MKFACLDMSNRIYHNCSHDSVSYAFNREKVNNMLVFLLFFPYSCKSS